MRLAPVEDAYVNITWPLIEKYVEEAITLGDPGITLYTIDHIRSYVTSGQWLLLVGVDEQNEIHGAMVISFQNYPFHRVATIAYLGGKGMSSPEIVEQLKVIVKMKGATVLQALARSSMVRLSKRHKFKPRNTLVEVLL